MLSVGTDLIRIVFMRVQIIFVYSYLIMLLCLSFVMDIAAGLAAC
jgi:hypothetical protein